MHWRKLDFNQMETYKYLSNVIAVISIILKAEWGQVLHFT
jgi:hypothetical protein